MEDDGGFGLTLATLQDCQRLLEDATGIPTVLEDVSKIIETVMQTEATFTSEQHPMNMAIHLVLLQDARKSAEILVRQAESMSDLVSH